LRDSKFSHFAKNPTCERQTDKQTDGLTRDNNIIPCQHSLAW